MGRTALARAAVLITWSTVVSAQTINPRVVEFVQSPDHYVVDLQGRDVLTEYQLELFMFLATAPFHTVSLGKPVPGSNGICRYDFSSQVVGWPLPGGTYEARVAALGPGGTTRSTVSNPFMFTTTRPRPAAPGQPWLTTGW